MTIQRQDIETTRSNFIKIIEEGDLLSSKMQTLVNTVNCHGAMGKGLALEFKIAFPEMFQDYQKRCKKKEVILGKPYLWKKDTSPPIWILNFPTKDHWTKPSLIEDIRSGLDYLAQHAHEWGITSLAIPALGCGLGGLNWDVVLPEIQTILAPLNIPIHIYKSGPNLEKKRTKGNIATNSIDRFFGTISEYEVLNNNKHKKQRKESAEEAENMKGYP